MHATTARKIAKDALSMDSIKEPLTHIEKEIGFESMEGNTSLILAASPALLNTTEEDFSRIITILKKQDYLVSRVPLKSSPTDHPLNRYIYTISWN